MRKRIITKRIVQVVAVAFGLLGLIWIFAGFNSAASGFGEPDRFATFYVAIGFLLLGGACVAIAWQSLRRFGPNAVRNVAGLAALLVFGGLMRLAEPLQEAARDLESDLYEFATFLIPLLLAVLFYKLLSRSLLQLTEAQSSQPHGAAGPDEGD